MSDVFIILRTRIIKISSFLTELFKIKKRAHFFWNTRCTSAVSITKHLCTSLNTEACPQFLYYYFTCNSFLFTADESMHGCRLKYRQELSAWWVFTNLLLSYIARSKLWVISRNRAALSPAPVLDWNKNVYIGWRVKWRHKVYGHDTIAILWA